MAPARRQNYARSRSRSHIAPSGVIAPSLPIKQDLMPPTSRYLHNLKVIQRHDPSITSLFDQFPHVCVYHHKGDEWQKKGCEGAMFLFERQEEPKYGFYILNRNNTGDYIQRMTPEDDVEFASAYLIYRAFGKVTSDTIGLWTMVTQDREAMSQVMMRLHSYIKRDIRYPDEYRRTPDTWSTTPAPAHAEAIIPPRHSMVNPQPPSTLSTLLAKLGGPPGSVLDTSPPNRSVCVSVPPSTGIPLLDSIFASASEAVAPLETTSQMLPPNENALHALFSNGVSTSQSSSTSTSCGPTPTQHISELPKPSSPSRPKPPSSAPTVGTGRSVFPYPGTSTRTGRDTAPPVMRPVPLEPLRASKSNGNGSVNVNRRSYSTQYLTVPDTTREDEDGWEEEAVTNVSAGASEEAAHPQPSSRRHRARNAKKREREKERRRTSNRENSLREAVPNHLGIKEQAREPVEWPLVDDRSLSLDEEDNAEEGTIGLGDGLLSALAAVSEPEGRGAMHRPVIIPMRKNKERGRDRRKRKHKEHEKAASQTSEMAGDASSSASSHPVEVRSALLDAYGHRRRVGDSVLSERALAAEVIHLINNDSTFVRELHQQYLRKVQL